MAVPVQLLLQGRSGKPGYILTNGLSACYAPPVVVGQGPFIVRMCGDSVVNKPDDSIIHKPDDSIINRS